MNYLESSVRARLKNVRSIVRRLSGAFDYEYGSIRGTHDPGDEIEIDVGSDSITVDGEVSEPEIGENDIRVEDHRGDADDEHVVIATLQQVTFTREGNAWRIDARYAVTTEEA